MRLFKEFVMIISSIFNSNSKAVDKGGGDDDSSRSAVCTLQRGYSGPRSSKRMSSLSTDSDESDEENGVVNKEVGDEDTPERLPADDDTPTYANVTPAVSPSSGTSFTVRHLRVLDWPAGRAFPDHKSTLLMLYSQLVECQQNKDQNNDRFLVHCL